MLFEVILSFERFAADVAGESDIIFVTPLVNHEIVRFGKSSLAKFAYKVAFGSHFPSKLAPLIRLQLHYRKHLESLDSSFLWR